MGCERRVVYDLINVIQGEANLNQALIKDKQCDNLFVLAASQTRDKDAVTKEEMIELVDQLREEFDFVLIDSPAGIESGFKNAIAGADEIIIVTTPEVSAVRDADRIIGLCEAYEKGQPRLILNRLRPKMVRSGEMMSVEDVLQILAIDLIGIIPEDEDVITATNKGEVLVLDKSSRTGKYYIDIARRINGEEVAIDPIEDTPSLIERISNMFRGGR
jgi:septum site-determining protein MinD